MNPTANPQRPDHRWCQISLWCQSWQAAEQMASTHLGPRLTEAEAEGVLTSWWFIRKDTRWHVRYLARPGQDEQAHTKQMMRDLAADGTIVRWARTHYEPEIHAFGGSDGMAVAHELFHADSRHFLNHLRRAGDRHRSELGVLLACALMRAADQDYYEQGDIWAQVAAHRATDRPPTDTETHCIRKLLTARTINPVCTPTWPAAFQQAGVALAELTHHGRLTRGLRAILTHHILFAWNRAGISGRRQALLAQAATNAVFHSPPTTPIACVCRRLTPETPTRLP